jgi:hypothetical protein
MCIWRCNLARPTRVGIPQRGGASSAGAGEPNRFRVAEDNFRADNFGFILIDWSLPDPLVRLQVRDAAGAIAAQEAVKLSELKGTAGSGGLTLSAPD